MRGDELGIRHFSAEPGGIWSDGEPQSFGFERPSDGERECKLFGGRRYYERCKVGQWSSNGLCKNNVARVECGAGRDVRADACWSDSLCGDGVGIREQRAVQGQSCICTVAASVGDQWNAQGQLLTGRIRRPGSSEPCVKGQRRGDRVDECNAARLERGHSRVLRICAGWGDSVRRDRVAIRHKPSMPNEPTWAKFADGGGHGSVSSWEHVAGDERRQVSAECRQADEWASDWFDSSDIARRQLWGSYKFRSCANRAFQLRADTMGCRYELDLPDVERCDGESATGCIDGCTCREPEPGPLFGPWPR